MVRLFLSAFCEENHKSCVARAQELLHCFRRILKCRDRLAGLD